VQLQQDSPAATVSNSGRRPLVTVIMCVYNAGKYLRPSLKSVLEQTYRNLDVIIIDDGSTDGCFGTIDDLVADPRVRVFHQANATKPVALNCALDLVRGDFYAIQDADDISFPTRIERQVGAMAADARLAAVFCGNELIINDRSMAPIFSGKNAEECRRDVEAFRMPAHDPTGMFRMSLVRNLRYVPSLKVAETFEYILRIGEQHPMVVLNECLYGYRILPTSLTRRDPAWRQFFVVDALKRACQRRGLDYDRVFPRGVDGRRMSRNGTRDNNIASYFINSVLDQRRINRRLAALRTGVDCARLHPLDPHYYKALVYALVPVGLLARLRPDLSAYLPRQNRLHEVVDHDR
jgi:glycosyltransferase involved in cell wall biosynthesis